jgi:hypothetical protein
VRGVATLLEVTDTYEYYAEKGDKRPAPLTRNAWEPVDPKKRCEHAQRAVVVLGRRRGAIVEVCIDKTCKVHHPHASTTAAGGASSGGRTKRSPQEIAAEKRRLKAQQDEKAREAHYAAVITKAVEQAVKKAPATPNAAVLALVSENGRTFSSWKAFIVDQLEELKPYVGHFYGGEARFKKVGRVLAGFGVNVAAIEKELTAAAAPKAPAKRKAGKKR